MIFCISSLQIMQGMRVTWVKWLPNGREAAVAWSCSWGARLVWHKPLCCLYSGIDHLDWCSLKSSFNYRILLIEMGISGRLPCSNFHSDLMPLCYKKVLTCMEVPHQTYHENGISWVLLNAPIVKYIPNTLPSGLPVFQHVEIKAWAPKGALAHLFVGL